ncbi:hypothetical protein CISG_03635 [Coccidioides immitis RMSCC 3703]|uniref:Uncharacterized protein n=1 Tax=Coccidioides immitis RMSCC 3703 TaxID=454286 RepID=A0A0J8QM73_COCIT|nr:hypothetical protein CISG_03635 [Coccidioides immitis RMSCC 3703]
MALGELLRTPCPFPPTALGQSRQVSSKPEVRIYAAKRKVGISGLQFVWGCRTQLRTEEDVRNFYD